MAHYCSLRITANSFSERTCVRQIVRNVLDHAGAVTGSNRKLIRADTINTNATYRLCVAPMMGWSTPHARWLWRMIAPSARLYTEMLHSGAIVFGNSAALLGRNLAGFPVAAQLGGSNPQQLAAAAVIVEDFGYDEVNLNIGCPSKRVRAGVFGACLMRTPELVAECVAAMQDAVSIPVTVKCRLGVDDQDCEESLDNFIAVVGSAGCRQFIVHARKALLDGLSPKDNRNVPPLDYARVQRLRSSFSDFCFVLNGGITSAQQVEMAVNDVGGAMIGRAAWHGCWVLREFEILMGQYGTDSVAASTTSAAEGLMSRSEIARAYLDYVASQVVRNGRFSRLIMPLYGLYRGCRGGRLWRRRLNQARPEDIGQLMAWPLESMA